MGLISATSIVVLADTTPSLAGNVMRSYISPVVAALGVLATLVCVVIIIIGSYHYITSSGKPESLERAKKTIRNALIGLIIVLAAGVLTAILTHAYGSPGGGVGETMPTLTSIQPQHAPSNLVDVIINAITGVLASIVSTIATPFLQALKFFITGTPLMAANASVFKLWLAVIGITDALFVLLITLLGFGVMSYSTFGLDEIEVKHLLPQLGVVFLLANTSIFAIDGVISLSNAMIHALNSVFSPTLVWTSLSSVASQANVLSIATLIIMVFFLILVVCLLVYYVGRLVALYLGAVLSPLICITWLIPGFKDFAENAAKVYLATIFVLFIHVVILQLAASLFAGLALTGANNMPDPIMSLIVGLATVLALLKTQGLLMQMSYVSVGPKTIRKLGGQFITGISYLGSRNPDSVAQARYSVISSTTRLGRNITTPKITTTNTLTVGSNLTNAASEIVPNKRSIKTTTPNSTKSSKLAFEKGKQ
jgi:hypothetical protein